MYDSLRVSIKPVRWFRRHDDRPPFVATKKTKDWSRSWPRASSSAVPVASSVTKYANQFCVQQKEPSRPLMSLVVTFSFLCIGGGGGTDETRSSKTKPSNAAVTQDARHQKDSVELCWTSGRAAELQQVKHELHRVQTAAGGVFSSFYVGSFWGFTVLQGSALCHRGHKNCSCWRNRVRIWRRAEETEWVNGFITLRSRLADERAPK